MQMGCNLMEAIRLRKLLIRLTYECQNLQAAYSEVLKLTGSNQSERVVGTTSSSFDVNRNILKDNANFVDYNDGSKLDIDLAFVEFDNTLKANLDFRSQDCIKALMTNLGIEELRAVTRYQLM